MNPAEPAELIRNYLLDSPGFEVVRWHACVEDALRELAVFRPDVVLVNLHLPGMSGLECVNTLKRVSNKITTVIMSRQADLATYLRAFQAGADGFFVLPGSREFLEQTLIDALGGWKPFPREIQRQIVDHLAGSSLWVGADGAALTCAEREIMGYLALGLSDKEIGILAGNATATVHSFTGRIYKKLHVHSRAEAVRLYLGFNPRNTGKDSANRCAETPPAVSPSERRHSGR